MSNRSQAYATTSFGWRGIESSRNSRISDARLVDFTAYHLNFRGDCQTPRSILSNYWIIIVKQFPPSPGNASTGTVHAHDCQVMRDPNLSAIARRGMASTLSASGNRIAPGYSTTGA